MKNIVSSFQYKPQNDDDSVLKHKFQLSIRFFSPQLFRCLFKLNQLTCNEGCSRVVLLDFSNLFSLKIQKCSMVRNSGLAQQ